MVSGTDAMAQARRPLASKENILVADPGHKAESHLQAVVEREKALVARERRVADESREQEERQQDLDVLEMRLREREEALLEREAACAQQKQAQDVLSKELAKKSAELEAATADLRQRQEASANDLKQHAEARHLIEEGKQSLASAEQRLSERAGRLATREKRVADDEGAVLSRERGVGERERRLDEREAAISKAEALASRELHGRRCQAEQREMRLAELESRLGVAAAGEGCQAASARAETEMSRGPAPLSGLLEPKGARGRLCPGSAAQGRRQVAAPVGESLGSHTVSSGSSTEAPRSPSPQPSLERGIPGMRVATAAGVEFRDAEGNAVAFKLNGSGGVDYYSNGSREVCNVDCFARGRTLHMAGTRAGHWSPARKATVQEGEEAVLQRVLALFHPNTPEAHSSADPGSASSGAPGSGRVGPGEEVTLTLPAHRPKGPPCQSRSAADSRPCHAETDKLAGQNPKVVRFHESPGEAPLSMAAVPTITVLPPPASWEEEVPSRHQLVPRSLASTFGDASELSFSTAAPPQAEAGDVGERGGGRRRLTARKRAGGTAAPSDLAHTPPFEQQGEEEVQEGRFARLATAFRRRVSFSR